MRKSFIRRYSLRLRTASKRFRPTNTSTAVNTIPKNMPTISPALPFLSSSGIFSFFDGNLFTDGGLGDGAVLRPTDTDFGNSTFCSALIEDKY